MFHDYFDAVETKQLEELFQVWPEELAVEAQSSRYVHTGQTEGSRLKDPSAKKLNSMAQFRDTYIYLVFSFSFHARFNTLLEKL